MQRSLENFRTALNVREEGLRQREGDAKQLERDLSAAKLQLEGREARVTSAEALQGTVL